MSESFRSKLGRWLERFTFLHPWLLEFSHEYPAGRRHYVNRISRTFAAPRPEPQPEPMPSEQEDK